MSASPPKRVGEEDTSLDASKRQRVIVDYSGLQQNAAGAPSEQEEEETLNEEALLATYPIEIDVLDLTHARLWKIPNALRRFTHLKV